MAAENRTPSPLMHDLSGRAFGFWDVIALSDHEGPNRQRYWSCVCKCGTTRDVSANGLLSGKSLSCGCRHRERFLTAVTHHGHARDGINDPTYSSWEHMKARCLNKNNKAYVNYGGRGITIDPRWIDSFAAFLDDMGVRPDGMTLDRKDNNGNYELSNCRWATRSEQMQNRRFRMVTIDGITLSIKQWATRNKIKLKTVHSRLCMGWNEVEAVTRKPKER